MKTQAIFSIGVEISLILKKMDIVLLHRNLRIKDNESINVISSIMEDEQDHADNSIETLDDIMADEYKHWGYAQKYYEKK